MKGSDRSKPPADEAPAGDGPLPVFEGAAPLRAHGEQTWNQQCSNQLDRAAWLFGDLENFWKQRLIILMTYPTAEFHSRRCRIEN
eukprot:7930105-Pyramimonas_sp.AAC.1